MNMKKIKKFFTLARQHDGFTLVELIVVIAILAILGGVAVPAYGGYVKKADRAADEMLVNELNKAFASACSINGENYFGRRDIEDIVLEGNVVPEEYVFGNEKTTETFWSLYEGGQFKVFKKLWYDKTMGAFSGDNPLKATSDQIAAYLKSSFNNIGVGPLTEMVDKLVAELGLDAVGVLLMQDDFLDFLKNSGQFDAYCDADGNIDISLLGPALQDASVANKASNAVVLYTASLFENVPADNLVNALKTNSLNTIPEYANNLSGADAELFEKTLKYSMLTAYYGESVPPLEDADDVDALWASSMSDSGFSSYLDSEKADNDLDGFLAAMDAVNDNTGNVDWDDMENKDFYSSISGDIEDALGA